MQPLQHLVAAGAQRLGGGVKVEAVAALVLHLGDQDGLALEARRARDPVALGQHADDLAVRVLADLAHQRPPVGVRHPVLRLDAAVGVDAVVEALLQLRFLDRAQCGLVAALVAHGVHGLGVHGSVPFWLLPSGTFAAPVGRR